MKNRHLRLTLLTCVASWLLMAGFQQWGTPVAVKYPDFWPKPVYDFASKPLTKEAVLLGRILFYDPILSRDSTISCSSCHLSFTAFTHVDHNLSHGIDNRIGTRNAPALVNLAWSKTYMWDGAIINLDMQGLAPITHPSEMDEDLAHVVAKMQRSQKYSAWFESAFGDTAITGARILRALGQFQLTIISANAKYDQVMRGEPGIAFTDQEANGYRLFQQNCTSCHREPLFTDGSFRNNGLPIDTLLNDQGRMRITQDPSDARLFKVPTLRNVEFSSPYMHDGRFKSLYQVLTHYTDGIASSPTLDANLRSKVALSPEARVDLVAFLLTLTDKQFLFNREFGYPRELLLKANAPEVSAGTQP